MASRLRWDVKNDASGMKSGQIILVFWEHENIMNLIPALCNQKVAWPGDSYDAYVEVLYGQQGGAWHHQYATLKSWGLQTLSISGQDANAEMCYQCSETNNPPIAGAPATNPDRVSRRRYGC
eukprot:5350121-Pyramimonas_sp.AAC.1